MPSHCKEYKVFVFGWLWKREQWIHIPKDQREVSDLFEHANLVSESLMKEKKLNGMMMARSVRTIKPPHGTVGYLITWHHNSNNYSIQRRTDASCLKMKKTSNYNREDLCHCYFYYYNLPTSPSETDTTTNKNIQPMDQSQDNDHSALQPHSVPQLPSRKRDSPETRTVVLAPEKKRIKVENNHMMILLSLHEHNLKKRLVATEFPEQMASGILTGHRGDEELPPQEVSTFQKESSAVVRFFLGSHHQRLQACLRTAEVFKVDQETSIIEENQIDVKLWPLVEEADHAEIKQFVEEKAFKKIHVSSIETGSIIIDARWLRKWKRQNDKTLKVKSRLVARGCFDAQKEELTTRSTTATRLSPAITGEHGIS